MTQELDHDLLIRIATIQDGMATDVSDIKKDIKTINEKYATKKETKEDIEASEKRLDGKYGLIKTIVITACGIIIIGVLTTILKDMGIQAR